MNNTFKNGNPLSGHGKIVAGMAIDQQSLNPLVPHLQLTRMIRSASSTFPMDGHGFHLASSFLSPPRMGFILRQGKPWQGGCDELKPCTASQQVRHLPGKGAVRQPGASVAWRAATYCHEAYTAGGEATLLSLEILNVDAFVFIIAGAAPEAPLQARRWRVVRGQRTFA